VPDSNYMIAQLAFARFQIWGDDVGVRKNSRGRPIADHAEAIANIIRMLDADAGFSSTACATNTSMGSSNRAPRRWRR
jgi:hypothetical protein